MIISQAWPLWLDNGDGEPRPIIGWRIVEGDEQHPVPITASPASVLTTGERIARRLRERTGRGTF